MAIPDDFPRRVSRNSPAAETTATTAPPDTVPAAGSPPAPVPGSVQWRRAALLLCLAAQLITIAALIGTDPIPASWAALLLAIAPAPLAAATLLVPAPAARMTVVVTGVVVLVGIIGQITHTGLFFVPGLAALVMAALRLWREKP
jgi:hypothetical protein